MLVLSSGIACAQPKLAANPTVSSRAPNAADPAALCEVAIQTFEQKYRLPPHLLTAMALIESGREDPVTNRVRSWPWSVQANDIGHYFETKTEAINWVRDAQIHSITSIDVGCLQVNLHFHGGAFKTIDAAFDPMRNVDYAARFLLQLHAETSDWAQAIGFYHSRTPILAAAYRQHVQKAMSGPIQVSQTRLMTLVEKLALSWRATLDELHPLSAGAIGRNWDSLLTPREGQHKQTVRFAALEPR